MSQAIPHLRCPPAKAELPCPIGIGFEDLFSDPTYEPAYQAFVDEMAKLCRCSHDKPCDGLLAGGLCDNIQGSDENDWREDEDE